VLSTDQQLALDAMLAVQEFALALPRFTALPLGVEVFELEQLVNLSQSL
jgi:hypothetical protein